MEPFLDYYEILQVHPKADQETIDHVYRLLARRYHPDSGPTGSGGKFDLLTKAYRVLSAPEKRAEYDARYEPEKARHMRRQIQYITLDSAEEDRRIYQGILSILYVARRRDATRPGVGIVALERMLGLKENDIEFHMWYLKEKGWIERLDSGSFAITVKGVEAVLENNLLMTSDHLLPPGEAQREKTNPSADGQAPLASESHGGAPDDQ